MYRLLVLAVAVALVAPADFGRAAREHVAVEQPTIDIVAIDLSGRQTNLTDEPGWNAAPALAHDGRIAFFSDRDGPGDLYVMDDGGGNVLRLTNGAGVALGEDLEWSHASWSPEGDKIAFDGTYLANGPPCEQHCAGWAVQTIGAEGDGLQQIALGARAPAWSPNGRSLAYESDYDAYSGWARGVTITRLDGSASIRVNAFNTEGDTGPVWSPRGNKLAFQAHPSEGSPTWVYTVRADGSEKRRLARGHKAVWSPEGRSLAFVDDDRLFTINTDGTHKRLLSRRGELVVSAAWSPRTGAIAYIAGTTPAPGGASNLRVETVTPDGKHVHVLARERAATQIWGSPAWAPHSARILIAVEAH